MQIGGRLVAVAEPEVLGVQRAARAVGPFVRLGERAALCRAGRCIERDLRADRQRRERVERGRRRAHVVERDRLALDLVGVEQRRAAPPAQYGRELPAEVDSVREPRVQPEPAGRRVLVRGVAGDEDPPVAIALRDPFAAFPVHHVDDLVRHVAARQPPHVRVGVERGIAFEHRKPPQFLAVDPDQFTPRPARVGEAEEAPPPFVVYLHDVGQAQIDVVAVGDDALGLRSRSRAR